MNLHVVRKHIFKRRDFADPEPSWCHPQSPLNTLPGPIPPATEMFFARLLVLLALYTLPALSLPQPVPPSAASTNFTMYVLDILICLVVAYGQQHFVQLRWFGMPSKLRRRYFQRYHTSEILGLNGSTHASLTVDNSGVSLSYSSYSLEVGPAVGVGNVQKACTINVGSASFFLLPDLSVITNALRQFLRPVATRWHSQPSTTLVSYI
jgi:hypothetical protein